MTPVTISTSIRSRIARAAWVARCGFAAILFLAIGIALAQQGTPVRSAGEGSATRSARLWGVASSREFSNVNRDDARAALRVWFNIVARRRGFVLDSRMDIVDSTKEIRERLLSHSADLVMLSVPEYLELESSRLLVPVLTHAQGLQGGPLRSNVLLVKASSGATSIAALRGKNVLTFSRNGANSAMAWLDLLLSKERLGRAASFFASIKLSDKPQTCILPVFFGARDACVVDEVDLSLAKEMNPQLGQLRELARSRPMVESVIATPVDPHPYRKELIDSILSLHEDPGGRQILMVFKTERLVALQPGDLDSAREFWRDYYGLPGSPPVRVLPGAAAVSASRPDREKERY